MGLHDFDIVCCHKISLITKLVKIFSKLKKTHFRCSWKVKVGEKGQVSFLDHCKELTGNYIDTLFSSQMQDVPEGDSEKELLCQDIPRPWQEKSLRRGVAINLDDFLSFYLKAFFFTLYTNHTVPLPSPLPALPTFPPTLLSYPFLIRGKASCGGVNKVCHIKFR